MKKNNNRPQKKTYFNLKETDRLEVELKRKEQQEKEIAADNVLKQVEEKLTEDD